MKFSDIHLAFFFNLLNKKFLNLFYCFFAVSQHAITVHARISETLVRTPKFVWW